MKMREIDRPLKIFAGFALLAISSCNGGEVSESQSLYTFIRAVDPKNVLGIEWNLSLPHPCSNPWLGVRCKMRVPSITEIRLENLNLSGFLDAESLCKLPNLRVLILANNHIQGTIGSSIANCRNLVHLDIRGNFLRGSLPVALTKPKNLRRLEISNNCFRSVTPHFMRNPQLQSRKCLLEFDTSGGNTIHRVADLADASAPPPDELPSSKHMSSEDTNEQATWLIWIFFAVGITFFLLLTFFLNSRAAQAAKDREILRALALTPIKTPPPKVLAEDVKVEERRAELVFFVEEQERFRLEDLLEAAADLSNQSLCCSLYRVQLKNNAIFAVKRLKKLQVSYEEFEETMRKIGTLKHQNILPLIGYNSTNEEKLLIYIYQKNGSLRTLMENYIQGKKSFPWKHRLSIAVGIARGLDFIYQSSDDEEIIPHGNIKLSNILLNENEDPLISEYGVAKLLNLNKACIFTSNGYTAPEKRLTEQADVYSYGMILLELLTGKIVETNGLDLSRWVKAKVREEWTGEVFDKEIAKVEMYGFSLLNVSLKCVSVSPEERPSISEVLEKIEEIVNAVEEFTSFSTISSEPDQQDCCGLASRNTPGSNQ